ncbi:MAG: AraC family transcriptional regulator [Spirochaetota bacterium]
MNITLRAVCAWYNAFMRTETIYTIPAPDDAPIHVMSVGILHGSPKYVRRNTHNGGITFAYTLGGSGTLFLNDTRYTYTAGDVYVLPKGVSYQLRSDTNAPWRKIWCWTVGPLADAVVSAYRLHTMKCIPYGPRALFKDMLKAAGDADDPDRHMRMALLFHRIVLALSGSIRTKERYSPAVHKLMEYLDTSVQRKFRLSAAASVIGKGTAQTIRIFRKETGFTPYDYLIDRKMAHAKNLLAYGDMSVRAIARELCFSDEYHFSKQFKRRCGCAPLYFRRDARVR